MHSAGRGIVDALLSLRPRRLLVVLSRLLRHLDLAQSAVLQIKRQVHHVPQVVVTADIRLREQSPAVHFYCLEFVDRE